MESILFLWATFAMETYKNDPCTEFIPKTSGGASQLDEKTLRLTAQMHKAIAMFEFKVESQIIAKHPEWNMNSRCLFEDVH